MSDPEQPGIDEPRIGRDEWVARAEERIDRRRGLLGDAERAWARVPPIGRLALLVGALVLFGGLTSDEYLLKVGFNTTLYALLAMGLNVVVGWAGLLDLGYVAFFGFGGYCYAFMSSAQFNVHWPAIASIPLIVVGSALLGLLLGLPSRRLLGDYLAIVTLFFAQIFIVLVNNANRITPWWKSHPVDFTGGPNGIAPVDNINLFGWQITTVRGYYFLGIVVFAVIMGALWLLNHSRTGRAWRALREDPLAAQLMGMPVNRLKLLAFAFGAAIAGLTGSVFAAQQIGVFPGNFDIAVLITIYAMVILGGAGSLAGVVAGAFTINVALELLRTPDKARMVFYALLIVGLFAFVRPRRWSVVVLGGTIAFGFAVRGIVDAVSPHSATAAPAGSDWVQRVVDGWTVQLAHPHAFGNGGYGVLLAAVLGLTLARGVWRKVGLVPVLWLASFVWENRLVLDPSITRLLLLGALLIALMNARPQGLLGTSRVEIA